MRTYNAYIFENGNFDHLFSYNSFKGNENLNDLIIINVNASFV